MNTYKLITPLFLLPFVIIIYFLRFTESYSLLLPIAWLYAYSLYKLTLFAPWERREGEL